MSTDTPPAPPPPPSGGWLRPVALIVACLILGFVGGWILRGDDGTVTVLDTGAPTPTATEADGGDPPPATTGGTPPATTEEAPPPPSRGDIALAVLNGTDVTGLAADTAAKAESLGYEGVISGNAPTSEDPTTVYFATADDEPAAARVAEDLEFTVTAQLPVSGDVAVAAAGAAPEADVVVVLGP